MGAAEKMNQSNAKGPQDPTAVGPGGQNTNNAKKAPPRSHRTSEVQRELGGANFIGSQLSSPGPTANAVRTRGA